VLLRSDMHCMLEVLMCSCSRDREDGGVQRVVIRYG